MLKQYGPLGDNDPHKPVVATTWSLSFDIVSLSKGRVGVGKKRAERDRRASKW